jgi:hypothetical protein
LAVQPDGRVVITGEFTEVEFGFNLSWANGRTAVVEACTNLAGAGWVPISTNVLASDTLYVRDPFWTNFSQRLYRIRSP